MDYVQHVQVVQSIILYSNNVYALKDFIKIILVYASKPTSIQLHAMMDFTLMMEKDVCHVLQDVYSVLVKVNVVYVLNTLCQWEDNVSLIVVMAMLFLEYNSVMMETQ